MSAVWEKQFKAFGNSTFWRKRWYNVVVRHSVVINYIKMKTVIPSWNWIFNLERNVIILFVLKEVSNFTDWQNNWGATWMEK
jgi:hypothetical protein